MDQNQTIPADGPAAVEYRLRPAIGLRVVGFGFVALALPVLLEVARRTVDALDVTALAVVVWVSLLIPAGLLLVGGWLLLDRRPRLRLDADGFTGRTTYGLRTTTAPWKEVRDVQRVDADGGPVLLIDHGAEAATTIQPRYLDGERARIEEELRSRLNSAYGYRPLGPADTPRSEPQS